jgi:glycosyltransferase involved in cell wall biosynthesis
MEIIKQKKVVSIIIDTYNQGLFIEKAIESVINQNFPSKDMEIIVVDDGSSDDTYEIVKKYKDKIKYIYKENKGQASALNVGFENSNGEYLILLDADDYFREDKVLKVVEEFEKYEEVGFVGNGFKMVDEKGEEIDAKKIWRPDYPEFHSLKVNKENIYLFFSTFTITSATSLRKNSWKNLFPLSENSKIGGDMCLNLAKLFCGNMSFLKEELTYYRIHGKNLWGTKDKDKLPLHIEAMENAISYFKKIAENKIDPYVFKKILKFWEISIKEKILNREKRGPLIHIEFERFKLYYQDGSSLYKIYKILRFPFLISLILISPKKYFEFKNIYSEKKLFKIRKILFPD